jgi:hypothetical protein
VSVDHKAISIAAKLAHERGFETEMSKGYRDLETRMATIEAESGSDGVYIAELVEQVRKWKLAWQESTDREIELKAQITTLEAELLAARDFLAAKGDCFGVFAVNDRNGRWTELTETEAKAAQGRGTVKLYRHK